MATTPRLTNMSNPSNDIDFMERVGLYRQFDETRHTELEVFARRYQELQTIVADLRADLDDERTARRTWRQKAEMSDALLARNHFALVLIDGDGYNFNRNLYGLESGGAQAAHTLCTEVQQHLRNEGYVHDNLEIMAIVYFNKHVPTTTLMEANIIQQPRQLNEFFWSFTSSRSLFQVVDCGPGKERADSKLRDTYRFYANNAHCKYIFLACCHDSGYIAELDKYRHDPIARPKTRLVSHGNIAPGYFNLEFPIARFTSTFDMDPIHRAQKSSVYVSQGPTATHLDDSSSLASADAYSNGARTATGPPWDYNAPNEDRFVESNPAPAANTWSTVTANAAKLPLRSNTNPNLSVAAQKFDPQMPALSKTVTGDKEKGIPINRLGQRVDKKLQMPPQQELDRFAKRIEEKKLCNTHHLTHSGCFAYRCGYDHNAIDAGLKQTLRYKARAIPCGTGTKCRKGDCFYGHQCPWGDSCSNSNCNFYKNGLHDVDDLEIAKFVPAAN